MKNNKREKLLDSGWAVGDAVDFLGMHIVKFRVRNIDGDIMNTSHSNTFAITAEGNAYLYQDHDSWDRPSIREVECPITIELFTGIKDKYGQEIYVGDTIRDEEWCVMEARVELRDGIFGFYYEESKRMVSLGELTNLEKINE